ncbi:MAG TPA: VOC family protein [Acidimicrobiia bacterium]|nr:VOC family protein [Acidimicrobiia bacterium]
MDRVHVPDIAFVGVHLTVADMAASVAFYRRIGLDVPEPVGGGTHVEIDLGHGNRLALSTVEVTRMYDPGWREPSRPPAGALQFDLPSREAVDALYDDLVDAGHHGHLAPVDAFWGNRYAEVDDPDGNIVGFHGLTAP